jgi:hypothetical protein
VLEIKINLDAPCRQCGKKGATQSGLCLKCVGDAVIAKIDAERRARRTTAERSAK